MRLSPLRLAVAAVVSTVAACTLNTAGLGSADSRVSVMLPDAGGAAGVGGNAGGGNVAGAGGDAGANIVGAAGMGAAGSGVAGMGAAGAGVAGMGAAGSGAAGSGVAGMGAAGSGVAGIGAAGSGVAGMGAAGSGGGAAGATGGQAGASDVPDGGAGANGTPDAHPISSAGCADGTREGFSSVDDYPDIAACAGGWQIPGFALGLTGTGTTSPACQRHGGNDGVRPDGLGCSVADLCAEGWHVCESAHEFSTKATDCRDALPPAGGALVFYGTRQRGPDKTCDLLNQTGTNNVYGCGNFGSPAMAACAPFTRMIRDADCKANPPWMCVDGPIDYNVSELLDVTKPGSAHGGVLCCR